MKILVNHHELITHERLVDACRFDRARVLPKVRLKDALPVDGSGISSEQYRFSLQSHFDFLVTDFEWNTLFAVEFDGASHTSTDAARRDLIKNQLCERFALPLLRINANHLQRKFRQWDLLSYFVETWFLGRAFQAAQDAGGIPPDEDFDPLFVLTDGSDRRWPYWFAAPSQIAIQSLYRAGRIAHAVPSYMIGRDGQENLHCIAYVKISNGSWALIRTGMRSQSFDACTSDVLWQIGMVDLHDHLLQVLEGKASARCSNDVDAMVEQFRSRYSPCSSGGIVGHCESR